MRLPVEKKDRKKLFLTIAGGIVLLALIMPENSRKRSDRNSRKKHKKKNRNR